MEKDFITLTCLGVDCWDRLVFQGDNGRCYKTTELEPRRGFGSLSRKEKIKLLESLCAADGLDGEPDFPVWEEGRFILSEKKEDIRIGHSGDALTMLDEIIGKLGEPGKLAEVDTDYMTARLEALKDAIERGII